MAEPKEKRTDAIQGEILHVYDGIEEADNELPTWWLWTFYGAIAFAVVYWFAYHELEALPLPREEYAAALQAQAAGGEVTEELLTAMASNPDAVAAGEEIFQQNCAVCHKERGEGNIGPNLTDAYWLHGGAPTDIYRTIHDGVLQAGMPAWGQTLGAEAVQKVTAFVLSIRDTNVPGKEPQGERWVPGGGADEAAAGAEEEPADEAAGAEEEPADEAAGADEDSAGEVAGADDAVPAADEGATAGQAEGQAAEGATEGQADEGATAGQADEAATEGQAATAGEAAAAARAAGGPEEGEAAAEEAGEPN